MDERQKIEALPIVRYSMLVNHLGPSSANLLSRTVWKDGIDIEVPCEGIQRLCEEYAATAIATHTAEIAAREAEIANQALNYVSLFGELQNALAEIERLREAGKLAWRALCDAEAVLFTIDPEDSTESARLEELIKRVCACAGVLFCELRLPVSALTQQPTKD